MRKISLVVVALIVCLAGCYGGSHLPRNGSAAPDFTIQDRDHKVTLSQLRGKVVLLNFWATWCGPCVQEMPSLVQFQSALKSHGVTVLAVSVDADDSAYHKFLVDHKIDLLTVRDPNQNASNLYGTFKFPESYVIDRDGVLKKKFIGAVDWTQPEIIAFFNGL